MRRGTERRLCRRSATRKVLLASLAAGLIVVPRLSLTHLTRGEMKAEDFIQYITVASPYTKWRTWPGKGKLYKAPSPHHGHGALLTTYVNRVGLRSLTEKKGMADGSIIVTENYNADQSLAGITTMYKVAGYNPEAGDWYWLEATPTGSVVRSGKIQPCIDCHRAQAEHDYLWTGESANGK